MLVSAFARALSPTTTTTSTGSICFQLQLLFVFLFGSGGGGRRCFGSEPSSSFFLISRDFSFVVAVVVLGCDDVV